MPLPNAVITTGPPAKTIFDFAVNVVALNTLGRIAPVYQLGAFDVDLRGRNTDTYRHTLGDEISEAAPLAETVEVGITAMDRNFLEVSTAKNAIAVFVSEEVNIRDNWDNMMRGAAEVTQACARRLDTLFMAQFGGFSAPIGSNATPHTVQNLAILETAWQARTEGTVGVPLAVMHGDAFRDLRLDAQGSAASWFGTQQGAALVEGTGAAQQGRVFRFGQMDMVLSNKVPVGGGTGHTNLLMARGQMEGAIAMPFELPITLEVEWDPRRMGWRIIARFIAGMGRVNDLAGQAFITKP